MSKGYVVDKVLVKMVQDIEELQRKVRGVIAPGLLKWPKSHGVKLNTVEATTLRATHGGHVDMVWLTNRNNDQELFMSNVLIKLVRIILHITITPMFVSCLVIYT